MSDVERTLLISIALVILVVFIFLRNPRATIIPGVVVPVSLIGTFGVMYLCHYSLDNLSLMALTISTGFVVDDAIVVIENVMRHLEKDCAHCRLLCLALKRLALRCFSISSFSGGSVHPAPLNGRHRGSPFPRVRRYSLGSNSGFARRFTDHYSDDVFAAAESRKPEDHGRLYRASERVFAWILGSYTNAA